MKNKILWLLVCCMPLTTTAQQKIQPSVSVSKEGRLVYTSDALGNRIPDYSYCGYMGGDSTIPDVSARIVVPVGGDIQAAIDQVAAAGGGAVLLEKGTYQVFGSLRINTGNVVLRGSGPETILLGAGTDRAPLIRIAGVNNKHYNTTVNITDAYLPVNATTINVAQSVFKAGDRVEISRPCTKAWIAQLGTEHFGGGITALGWKPNERVIHWDRKVLAVHGNQVTLDAPLTTALDTTYGIATIRAYQWPGQITHVGVENLRCISAVDEMRPKDEDHRWMGITFGNATDSWVRQVSFEHFAGSAVAIWETAGRITVEDCISLAPVSEIGGQRRNTFFTAGQQTLFQRIYAQYGYHDFGVGYCAGGPNAFVQCESWMPFSYSGTLDSWASGVLLDNVQVTGQALGFPDRGQDGQGAGWSAANSMLWQCAAAKIICPAPPGAMNWSFGAWAQFQGDGYWNSSNEYINPRSLYYAQLADRLGKDVSDRARLMPATSEASSSPSPQQAAELIAQSKEPALTLQEWITQQKMIEVNTKGIRIAPVKKNGLVRANADVIHIQNGRILKNNQLLTGGRHEEPWWRGGIRPEDAKEAVPALTRFVPGRTGTGFTDDLDSVVNWMQQKNIIAFDHNYGLWYERRRDDHERVLRIDGDVWPPFYEQPFARSGEGTAWDGLSKYDITKYNTWYWTRLQQFASKGKVLIHENYFQHNIIEAGAHYADFPWRPANNVNNTGFPEPPPYAGGKRIFMAAQFYDTTHPVRRALHQAYIRQCMESLRSYSNVIQLIGAEFTGPLHFVQFWVNTIDAYKKDHASSCIIGLSTTKDVQDSILQNPVYSHVIDLIDIRYWYYQQDSKAYAPQGGQNLAPRQHARLLKPKKTSEEMVYKAVREYREKYPEKAVIYSADSYDRFGWAVLMAGGSLADIPVIEVPGFLIAAADMQPVDMPCVMALKNTANEYIIYCNTTTEITVDAGVKGTARWIDAKDGHLISNKKISSFKFHNPQQSPAVLWISRK
ncbi:DUF6298 domain-containing protein [Chitinophaga sancti]|uniref:DUF6298 domain-containing protein n=1 Tax=Chitinophaga sancti TaxID=1004 RepID=UPI002A75EF9C|nr:DUF6298 domain-containing protein [Chitinophaga sancti]WPQ65253.1 DUF6298 domain-containing protein [Chitinophaga sancti]